jgi:hypothetical protein
LRFGKRFGSRGLRGSEKLRRGVIRVGELGDLVAVGCKVLAGFGLAILGQVYSVVCWRARCPSLTKR